MPKNETRALKLVAKSSPKDLMLTESGFSALRAYLGHVHKGQPKVYTAPFAKGVNIQKVLEDWQAELRSIADKWPTLWDYEIDLANKVGPLSVQKPLRERLPDISQYYEGVLLPSKPIAGEAVNAVCNEWSKLRGLRVRGIKRTTELMKKSTNSGLPYFTKRRNVTQDTIPCWSEQSRFMTVTTLQIPQDVHWETAAVLGWRGQEGGPQEEDVKQRVVWMFPYSVNVNELQVYQPLIESAQTLKLVPAWVSMDEVDKRITRLFDTKDKDDLVVCTDFSKFDQHFNRDLQNAAEDILRSLMSNEWTSMAWLRDVFPIKYSIPLVFDADQNSVQYFIGKHGMGSGSGGTICDETLAHRALQYEAAQRKGKILNPNSQCLGDDGMLSYPGITVEDVVESYSSHGQECNPDKQYASTQDCVYLRRWHHMDYRVDGVCVGVYSTCRAIGRLRYLERFMDPEYWSPELVALRQLSIIENCKWHPMFTEFIQFCMKRDKYRLGIDIPGFLDNITQLAKEATDYMPDFLGYTKTLQGEGPSGIADWSVVKYLKSIV